MDLKTILKEKDELYYKSDEILGKNLLTLANRLNSSRGLMISSQLDQIVTLKNPETPKVYTNYEQIVAKYSSSKNITDSEKIVVSKIVKYKDYPAYNYVLVVYDTKKDMYDIITRKPGEILTETYGYKYVNTNIDMYNEGDTISENEILYHSTAFDECMNFGYGINALAYYTTDPMTIEDGIKISQSLADRLVSIEYDRVRIPINDNDILINYYGDKNNFKAFPDIGEPIKNATIAVKRRITYSQALFDLKEENMQKILATDTPYYIPFSEDKVIDVNIYCNKDIDELPDSPYYDQIKYYLKEQTEYYKEIVDVLKPIMKDKKYSDDLAFLYSKARRILDNDIKWKDQNNNVFSNIILELDVEKEVGCVKGSKLAGRYGNKGVITEICPDEEMPYDENGRHVDIIYNILGVGNRENTAQLNEVEINFLGNQITDKMKSVKELYNKEYYYFGFLSEINHEYYKKVKQWYDKLSLEDKESYIKDIEDNYSIRVEQPPMYDNAGLEEISNVYDRFNIKPITLYVDKFGEQKKIMNKVVIGEEYIIKLKHHPKSKFSSRSSGVINSKDQPTKTNSTKNNVSIFPATPRMMGILS